VEHPLPSPDAFSCRGRTCGPDATTALGARAAALLKGGETILLWGPLGAGKTLFVQGLCRALGVGGAEVGSPTFTLVNTYEGPLTVHHLDLYRLDAASDLHDLGLDAILDEVEAGAAVLLCEWPDPLLDWVGERLELLILPDDAPDVRRWHLRGTPAVPAAWSALLEETA